MKQLQQLLKNAIKSKQKTVKAIADDCKCSRQHIYQIIRGEQQPTIGLAEKILSSLGAELTIKMKAKRKTEKLGK